MPGGFDEAQHPRANDGKFSQGGGGPTGKKAAVHSTPQERHAAYMAEIAAKAAGKKSGRTAKSDPAREAAKTKAASVVAEAKTKAASRTAATKATEEATHAGAREAAVAKAQSVVAEAKARVAASSRQDTSPVTQAGQAHGAGDPAIRRAVVADAARRALIAAPMVQNSQQFGAKMQWSPESQRAIREHHDAVLAQYGLHNHDATMAGGKKVGIDSKMTIGDAQVYGSHSSGGEVTLWDKVADHLAQHARLGEKDLASLGQRALSGDKEAMRMMDAYRVSTHESLHGHGPTVILNSRNGTYFDEVSTELTARRVVADVHGIQAHQVPGSYDRYIEPTLEAAAKISGRSREEVHKAFTDAAIALKREKPARDRFGQEAPVAGDEQVRKMVEHSMRQLGVTDQAKHEEMYRQIDDDIDNSGRKKYAAMYPSENRYK